MRAPSRIDFKMTGFGAVGGARAFLKNRIHIRSTTLVVRYRRPAVRVYVRVTVQAFKARVS